MCKIQSVIEAMGIRNVFFTKSGGGGKYYMKLKQIKDFIQAYRNVNYYFEPIDEAILHVCRKNPYHSNTDEVFAKIALVNRIYRANLSRYLGRTGKDAEWRLAERLVQEKLDKNFLPLKDIRRFNKNSIDTIVQTHEKLVKITYSITKKVQNSFCSKYLNFHFPKIIPIFDSYSYAASWNLVGKQVKAIRCDENLNYDYGYHCETVLLLVEALLRSGIRNPDLKLVDCVLYGER